eukprot:TRINITY_DN9634_c0_g1_i1.p2 TRINITY_DN9634_c0_g1~~TRINITY_DN9634_c0_g1_i1.p2  ORF type:complete len:288 (+),score=112.98 TRINITY_DN9634_c0_g1_i1:84-866(+)
MRRGVGVGYVKKRQEQRDQMSSVGEAVRADQLKMMMERHELFQRSLKHFAEKHGDKIRSDPTFRYRFNQMCQEIGVDPLQSNKGFWAEVLGIGNFYFELAQQCAEICLMSREFNGGLIALPELLRRVRMRRSERQRDQIDAEDVAKAVSKLACLGGGFRVLTILGGGRWVQSQSSSLGLDGVQLVAYVQEKTDKSPEPPAGQLRPAFVTEQEAASGMPGWTQQRARDALQGLLQGGICWIDQPDRGPPSYWFPGLLRLDG